MCKIIEIPECQARKILFVVGFQDDLMNSAILDLKKSNLVESSQSYEQHETERITRREKEVLILVAHGQTSKGAAAHLGISHRTVDSHRANLMDKLDLENVQDIVKYAIQKGFI